MNTGLSLRPGVPAVLGGPSTGHKSEVYAVILIGRVKSAIKLTIDGPGIKTGRQMI